MSSSSSHNHSFKRTATERQEEQEAVTDDLEVAAAYAMAQYTAPTVATVDDENEIDVEDEDDENETETDVTAEKVEPEPAEESDAESDVDLTEALRQMEQDGDIDDDEEEKKSDNNNKKEDLAATAHHQTAHEVDGYHGSVQQVEQVFGTSLRVDAQQCAPQHTQPAGHVQHFMAEERILVVQSLGNSPLLLEEGNLLVLKEPEWIPLGKILEVFGPVSQPMYSIRLPEPVADSTTEAKDEDPWSPTGRYTKWLQQHPSGVLVHYLPQQAKLVDTHMLLAQRQRGCDASNMHDEEVTTEMDFSDDEQERQSKQRRRKGNSNTNRRGARPAPQVAPVPGGFYNAAPSLTAAPPHAASSLSPPPPPPMDESDTIYYD